MTSPSTQYPQRRKHLRRVVAVVAAATALGVSGAFAVSATAEDDDPEPVACAPTSADLQRAADAARVLEVQRPDLFDQSPRPAGYGDLRLAAEWSDRMSELDPDAAPSGCSP